MSTALIDTHCHLDLGHFPEGADAVIERARESGVGALVCIGVGGVATARGAVELAERCPQIVATAGIHPHEAGECDTAIEQAIVGLLSRDQIVAVGEVGLDYHYDYAPRETQQEIFRRFIAHARRLKLPLVIHTREASEDTLRILEEEQARDVGGVIHCFSEDLEFARRALDLDFDLSFSGIVTFKKALAVQEVAAWVPSGKFFVETDSPYLAPVPRRGKRCEPAYVAYTAKKVAELRGVGLEELTLDSSRAACRRFGAPLEKALASGNG